MNAKILIVEDEFIIANDLRMILQKAGYQVVGIAASVEQAQRSIEQQKPDLILLDIQLKGHLTGIDLAKQLKQSDIAFVYLSANSNQQVLEQAKATEPYGFLVKPFRTRDVLITLDIALYRHEHSHESRKRRASMLEESLGAIQRTAVDWAQKSARLALAIQAYVPFDYLTLHASGQSFPWTSFFRTGFDQYQAIGVPEWSNITGLKPAEIEQLLPDVGAETPAFYNEEAFEQVCKQQPYKELFAKKFKLASNLVMPLNEAGTDAMTLECYSRKPDAYQDDHLDLLVHLKSALASLLSDAGTESRPENNHSATAPENNTAFKGIIGNSPQLLNVLDMVTQVAPHDTSVLILGESGTGKERISTFLHELSPRKTKPLVKVNCAALPANLIESELFGHEKGAFTGATDKRTGKFELADGGTIFLDEIGEMPLDLQAKLLRVLQEKEIERIGGKASVKVNVRIVAATNRNLEKEVAEGRFRLDLYYRLNVFPLYFPPLRERTDDIPLLANYFAIQCCERTKKRFPGISPQMMNALENYHWPGNIRELENIVEQSVILNDGNSELQLRRPLESTLFATGMAAENPDFKGSAKTLQDVKHQQEQTERDYILSVLKKTKGRIRGEGGAAELMQLKPTTLESRMAKLGIRKEDVV